MSGRTRIVVVGDALVDRDVEGDVHRICPDAPVPVLDESSVRSRPGGAALAAALAAAGGVSGVEADVVLVTAVGADGAGRDLVRLAEAAGVEVLAIPSTAPTAEKIRLRAAGQTLLRLDRGGAGLDDLQATGGLQMTGVEDRVAGVLAGAGAVLIADYGRGVTRDATIRSLLEQCGRPLVWDPHPRGAEPVPGCRVLTPNASEVLDRFPGGAERPAAAIGPVTAAARRALAAWRADAVAVTRGGDGAMLVAGDGPPLVVPVPSRHAGDPCGAGDCFAAGVTVRLAGGELTSEAVTGAVGDAARFVAAGGAAGFTAAGPAESGAAVAGPAGGAPQGPPDSTGRRSAEQVTAAVQAAGGTVVAAGGCFDLLHAGHVSLLQSARALGDCLIVCINSDRSVRRLKGPGRPVNPEEDRAATLAALDCVDAVAIFDEDTPEQVIRRLRPAVWVKGGDYDGGRLPEAAVLSDWGGQAVVLPYLAGRSTTRMLARASTTPP